MALQKASFQEIILREIFIGNKIMYKGVLEVIKDIQFEPKTRQIIIETDSGVIFTCFKDDEFEFDLLSTVEKLKPNAERLKGNKNA